MQTEEKQELAAASLDYNLDHAQLKAMFPSELQAAKSGSIQTDDQSASAQPTTTSQGADLSSSTQTGPSDSMHESDASSAQNVGAGAHHSDADAQAERLETMQFGDLSKAQPTAAVPASVQSAALDMLQKQLAEGQPEEALTQIEAALKYVDHGGRNAHEMHEVHEGFCNWNSATVGGSPMKQTQHFGAHIGCQAVGNLHTQCRIQMRQVCWHVIFDVRKTTPLFLHLHLSSPNVQDVTLVMLQASSDTWWTL